METLEEVDVLNIFEVNNLNLFCWMIVMEVSMNCVFWNIFTMKNIIPLSCAVAFYMELPCDKLETIIIQGVK